MKTLKTKPTLLPEFYEPRLRKMIKAFGRPSLPSLWLVVASLEGARCPAPRRITGTRESDRAVPYPPSTRSHTGGRLFPAGCSEPQVQAAPKSAKASRHYLGERPDNSRRELNSPHTHLLRPPHSPSSGGATLKCRLRATSALPAKREVQRSGTDVSRFLRSPWFYDSFPSRLAWS